MTVLLPCGRTLSKQLLPRSGHLLTRLATTHPTLRVSYPNGRDSASQQSQTDIAHSVVVALPIRTYATAPSRPAGRPKAHTGRSTAKRTTRTTSGTKRAAPKRAGKKPGPKPKKAKAKPKPKPLKREPTPKSLARKAVSARAELKRKALLTGAPKKLPDSAWAVVFSEHSPKKGQSLQLDGSAARTASQAYKNISPEDHERVNRIANENKVKNEAAYKQWVQSHTPLQIKEANTARDQLKREAKKNGTKKQYQHIKDDRLVKLPPNAYAMFLGDRVASGDMNGMKVSEIGKLAGREFREMSASQKKSYEDRSAAERNRYYEEFKSVYGFDPPAAKRANAAAAA